MFDISVYIDKICKMKNKNKMSIALETLVKKLSTSINYNSLQFIKSNNIV